MGESNAHMGKRQPRSLPTWTAVRAKLVDFDRAALLDLIHNLYAAHKDNQLFLHARFGLEKDVLESYKETIDRWLWPDVLRNQDTSVARAKQAISAYKKAVGDPASEAELMVSTASGLPGSVVTLPATMKDFSTPWCVCLSVPSCRRTHLPLWPSWSCQPVRRCAGGAAVSR